MNVLLMMDTFDVSLDESHVRSCLVYFLFVAGCFAVTSVVEGV